MEESIVKVLIMLGSLIVGWCLGYGFCDVVKPVLLERRRERLKKKQKESEKTWTITPPDTHPKIEIELHGGKPEFDWMCKVSARLLTKYDLDKVVIIERQDNGLVKQYETIKRGEDNEDN